MSLATTAPRIINRATRPKEGDSKQKEKKVIIHQSSIVKLSVETSNETSIMALAGIANLPLHDQWCHTSMKIVPFSCIWKINNFSDRGDNLGETLKSSIFLAENYEHVKFTLTVSLMFQNDDTKDHLSVFLNLVSCNTVEARTKFEVSILNARNKKAYTMKANKANIKPGSSLGWPKYIDKVTLKKDLNGLLPGDALTLFCKGSIAIENSVNTFGKGNIVQFEVPKCAALCDLGQLLESHKYTDVTISVCNGEIHAHKAILAARSSVFAAMIDCKVEDPKDIRIEIPDVEPEVINEMLRFIYTGEAPNIEELASVLIAVADKYDLTRLKVMCAEALFKTLATNNAVNTLILADRHGEQQLRFQSIHFICTYLKHVVNTSSYGVMANKYPYLIEEILRALAGMQTINSNESHNKRKMLE